MAKVTDFARTEFALAFAETAISLLVRQRSGPWERVDRAPVSSGHLNAAMAEMRLAVPGDGKVHVFLPPEHVMSCRISPDREVDLAAHFAARAGCDADSLAIVHWRQPATGQKLAIAADRTTIAEAAAYAVSWGFRPVSIGVHPETVPDGAAIRFPFQAPRSAGRALRRAAAIGTLILLGGAVLGAVLNWPVSQPQTVAAIDNAPGDATTTETMTLVASPEQGDKITTQGNDTEPVLHDTSLSALEAPAHTEAPPLTLAGHSASRPDRLQPAFPRTPGQTSLPAVSDARPRVQVAQAAEPLAQTADIAGAPVLAAVATEMAGSVRLAALTPAETPSLPDALPLVAIAPADPPDDAPLAASPDLAAPSTLPEMEEAGQAEPADSTDVRATERAIADTAGGPVEQPPAPLAWIDGPRSLAPLARPEGLAPPTWRTLGGPRSSRPQARPAGLVRRIAALRLRGAAATPVSSDVAELATVSGTLPLGEAGLLGIVTSGNRREAIVMLASGEIARVGNGDRVGGWTVATVNDDYIRLTGRGERRTLHLLHR